jgi:hypothetical protein
VWLAAALTTNGRPERLFTKLEHFHQIRARFLKKTFDNALLLVFAPPTL